MLSQNSFAQEESEKKSMPKFSGIVDGYYKIDPSGQGATNSYTSFTGSQRSFNLGSASIKTEHSMGKVGAVMDLGFGRRIEEFVNIPGGNTQLYIKEAYLTYEVMKNLTLTGGTFGTHIGYEVLNATDNKNYSMSYAFTYGPFFNTGLKANYVMDEFNFMLGVSLPTNSRTVAQTGSAQKHIIGQIGYTGDERSAYFGFTSGSNNPILITNENQFDIVFKQKITEKFDAGLNATYHLQTNDLVNSQKRWFSTVLYLGYDVLDNLSVNYRGERFSDTNNVAGVNTNVIANTISANYKVGSLTIIPELRGELADRNIYVNKNNNGTRLNSYFLLAATYAF